MPQASLDVVRPAGQFVDKSSLHSSALRCGGGKGKSTRNPVSEKERAGTPARASNFSLYCSDPRAHRLGLRVVVEDVVAHLAAPAGLLVSTERQSGVKDVVAVDPHRARLQL